MPEVESPKKMTMPRRLTVKRLRALRNRVKELRERQAELSLLLDFGKKIASEQDLNKLLNLLVEEAKQILKADRCSVFVVDGEKQELWSKVAQGTDIIRLPLGKGLAGYVAFTGETVNIPDAYNDPRFNPEVDRQTGYKTHSLLTMPMRDMKGETIGVFQVLNKTDRSFDKRDEELLMMLAGQAAVAVENAQLYEKIRQASEDTIFRLAAAAEYKDKDTHAHLWRMSQYSVIIARQMKFKEEWIDNLRLASVMHDIGKLGVPDSVLLKPDKLLETEYAEIKKHSIYGGEILKDASNDLLRMSERVALCHHEKWDGTGYPYGLKDEAIPIEARIVALADTFDALTSKRVYKPAYSLEDTVIVIIEESGKSFDPQVVDVFLAALPEIKKMMESEPGRLV